MEVPITSDLHGYAAFWGRWLLVLSIGMATFAVTVIALLILILRKLP